MPCTNFRHSTYMHEMLKPSLLMYCVRCRTPALTLIYNQTAGTEAYVEQFKVLMGVLFKNVL